MKNKVLVEIRVPEIGEIYSVYLPSNKKIGNIIILLNKAINEITNGEFPLSNENLLFDSINGTLLSKDGILLNTNIRNGSKLILLS